jgi:hypothetical protein
MLLEYSRVRLMTDRFESQGVSAGMFGYVIEVYDGGNYEVEFSDEDGTTIAQIVATEHDLAPEPEVRAATEATPAAPEQSSDVTPIPVSPTPRSA